MSDSILSITDVKTSLGLLLPSGKLLGGAWQPAGGGLSQLAISVAGLTSDSVVQVTMQQLDPTDLTGGVVIYSAQPTATGGGNILVTAKTPSVPAGLALAWQVVKF